MPYETTYEEKGVYWNYYGVVTGVEILHSNLEFYGDNRFDQMRYQLCNFMEADRIEMSVSEVKKLAYLDLAAARSNERIKVAIISGEEIIRNIGRIYSKYTQESPWETRLFASLTEARKWIERGDSIS